VKPSYTHTTPSSGWKIAAAVVAIPVAGLLWLGAQTPTTSGQSGATTPISTSYTPVQNPVVVPAQGQVYACEGDNDC
jgi:hypothetical protein